MKSLRSINLSAAIIVIICFFLPWEQVSCAGARDNLSGVDLARHNDVLLWMIPVLMGALVVLHILRARREQDITNWMVGIISGGVTAFLMNRERMHANDASGVIAAQLTGWFWLAFISTFVVIVTAILPLLRRQRAP